MKRRCAVDLEAVRLARARLARIIEEHPELVGEASEDNRAGWEATLEAGDMAENDEQIVVRLPKAIVERVDAFVERAKKEQPGMRITRSDGVRMLLLRALDDAEPRRGKR